MKSDPVDTKPSLHSHAHSHGHGHSHSHSHGAVAGRIQFAFWLNISFALIEAIGGWLTGSVAIVADAVHDLGDSLSLGLAWVLERQALKGPSKDFSYGLKRLSLLSAVITGVVLVSGSVGVAFEALRRLQEGASEPNAFGMMGLAVLGVAVNGLSVVRLRSGSTYNEKILTWHLIEDLMGWVAILIGSGFIYWFKWNWMDPLLALGISTLVIWNAVRHLNGATRALLQAVPHSLNTQDLRGALIAVPGIKGIHDLHAWTLNGEHHVMSLHVVCHDLSELSVVKQRIRDVAAGFGIVHSTIEIEMPNEECSEDCDS